MPTISHSMTIALALENARSRLLNLYNSILDVTERGDARLNGMDRVKTLRKIADEMEKLTVPFPPAAYVDLVVEFRTVFNNRPRGISRRERAENICTILQAVHSRVMKSSRSLVTNAAFLDQLTAIIVFLENVEFPKYFIKKEKVIEKHHLS